MFDRCLIKEGDDIWITLLVLNLGTYLKWSIYGTAGIVAYGGAISIMKKSYDIMHVA